jgi:hypothetical protein
MQGLETYNYRKMEREKVTAINTSRMLHCKKKTKIQGTILKFDLKKTHFFVCLRAWDKIIYREKTKPHSARHGQSEHMIENFVSLELRAYIEQRIGQMFLSLF